MSVVIDVLNSVVQKLRDSSLIHVHFIDILSSQKLMEYAFNNLPAILVAYEGRSFSGPTPLGTRRQPSIVNVGVYILGRYPAPSGEDDVYTISDAVIETLKQQIITSYPGSYATIVSESLSEVYPTALLYKQVYAVNVGGTF